MRSSKATAVSALAITGLLLGAGVAAAQHWHHHPQGAPPGGSRSAPVTRTVATDPVGDTFGVGMPQHDIVSFTVEPIGADLLVELSFVGPISPPTSGQPDALIGFVDFDTDQNPATGIVSSADIFCPMPAGIGSEFFLALTPAGASVVDTGPFTSTPIMPTFGASSVSVLIPLTLIGGDDGIVDAATVIGTVPEPTDCAPNGGFITSGDGVPTAGGLALALLSLLLLMGGHFVLRRRSA